MVNEIVDAFKDGTKDLAEFWIQMGSRFIYIRYFAIRDEQNQYKGTMEVSQDVTGIRKLEGEQRLLDWMENKDKSWVNYLNFNSNDRYRITKRKFYK